MTTTTTPRTPAKPQKADVARFQRELAENPELVARILLELPQVPEREFAIIKTDRESVDAAICKALALAVLGSEARLELTTQ
jgi:hypothetical protein